MTDFLNPSTFPGVLVYGVVFLTIATVVARAIRTSVKRLLAHADHVAVDRTGIEFMTQLVQVIVYVFAAVLYAHVVPALRQLGTALLAGVSVASVVIGLAAQSTLGSVIAGFSLLLYRPFRIGDRLQFAGPGGLLTGRVDALSLGYTIIRTDDGRKVIVPNGTMATQVTVNLNDVKTSAGAQS